MDRMTMGGLSMHRSTMGLRTDHNTMEHRSQHEGTQLVFARERVLRACSSAAEPWTGGSRGGEVMLAIACCARRTCSRACRA